jgi:hypothetical protein
MDAAQPILIIAGLSGKIAEAPRKHVPLGCPRSHRFCETWEDSLNLWDILAFLYIPA